MQVNIKDLQSSLNSQWKKAAAEGKKILAELGAETTEEATLSDIVAQIRENNPSLRQLAINLDRATYDSRKKLEWNARMMSAYAKFRAEVEYQKNLKPRLDSYRETTVSQWQQLSDQAGRLKARLKPSEAAE